MKKLKSVQPPPRKADVAKVYGVLGGLELVRNNRIFPLPLGEGAVLREFTSARNAGEGNDIAIAERVRNDGKQQTVKNLVPYSPITLLPSKKAAFTLAEVLITLGIIGVVAAMTMPVLMAQHRKTVVETRLKKFYSTINQAITLSEVYNGDKTDWQASDTETFWNKYLEPYLKYIKVEDHSVDTSRDFKAVYLPDGSLFLFNLYIAKSPDGTVLDATNGAHFYYYPEAKNYDKSMSVVNIDFGSKVFAFGFWPNETSNRYVMHKNKGVEPYMANWDGKDPDYLTTNNDLGCNQEGDGRFCTAIIMRNSWKIPKDYPFRF